MELVARTGKTRSIYKFLVGNLRGKRPVDRPGFISEIDINVDLTEMLWTGLPWRAIWLNGGLFLVR